jgi:hypothetical protein
MMRPLWSYGVDGANTPDRKNLPTVLTARSLSLHAREGRADLRSTDRPARAAWAALRLLADVANFSLAESGSGRTMELGRSGRTIDHAAAAAMVRSARASSARFSYGVFDNSSPDPPH